jgi:hypothetical protein
VETADPLILDICLKKLRNGRLAPRGLLLSFEKFDANRDQAESLLAEVYYFLGSRVMENGLVNDSLGTIRDNDVVWEEGKDLLAVMAAVMVDPFFEDTGTHLIGLILPILAHLTPEVFTVSIPRLVPSTSSIATVAKGHSTRQRKAVVRKVTKDASPEVAKQQLFHLSRSGRISRHTYVGTGDRRRV